MPEITNTQIYDLMTDRFDGVDRRLDEMNGRVRETEQSVAVHASEITTLKRAGRAWPTADLRLKRLEEHDATRAGKKTNNPNPSMDKVVRWLLTAVALGASIAFGYNLPQLLDLFK